MKNKTIYILVGLVFGVALAIIISKLTQQSSSSSETKQSVEKKPLYWVAPMDSNYRRDKPGKSPMGMDLVPVYKEDEDSAGVVKIHSKIINNLSVKIGEVKKEPLINNINTVGYITYDESTLIQVDSRTDGWIEKLFVNHNGQYIKSGQPIYTIYSPNLVRAQQEYLLAKARNNQPLLSAAKQRLNSLNFTMDQFKEIARTKTPLQNVTVYAKSDGLIDNLNVREGLFIKPGTQLMTIGNLDTVWVEVELFERQMPYVKVGQQVEMKLDYLPSKIWKGIVDYVYPIINSKNRTAKIRLKFSNLNHQLKPNMFADIAINTKSDENVLLVPQNAIIRTEKSSRVVLSLGQGKFKSVQVITGRVANDSIEILDGLIEGDDVVLSGQFLIDSESSIESDFKRFVEESKVESKASSATVNGSINSINLKNKTVNISRDAIPKWNRAPMTMDFELDESLMLSDFKVGETISFTFEIRDAGFFITEIHKGIMEHKHD